VSPAGGAAQPGWRLAAPVAWENLILYPILARDHGGVPGFVTLDEAVAAGDAEVRERGADMILRSRGRASSPVHLPSQTGAEVNRLVLVYRGSRPLVLLAGEVVTGGKQDRVIAKDRIIPPGADPLPLDVFCVRCLPKLDQ
jgi:hypothetical protein